MSEFAYPLNGEQNYTAEQAGAFFATRGSGVWSGEDNLAVSVSGARTLSLSAGLAWFTTDQTWGKVYVNTAPVEFELPVADGVLDCICRIVVRWNKTQNEAKAIMLQGELASEAVAPLRSTTDEIYDLVLADYLVVHGETEASAANLTDQRLNEDLCGLMRDSVTSIPTAQLQAQAQALIEDLRNTIIGIAQGSEVMLKEVYDPDDDGDVAPKYNHENILSNWYFADPVNSAGQTEYASGYTIDRWNLTNAASVTVNDNGSITVTAQADAAVAFVQKLENALEEGVYTLSAKVEAVSGYVGLRAQRIDTWTSVDSGALEVGLCSNSLEMDAVDYRVGLVLDKGASITLKAMKLEKGSVSTLAGDPPPNKYIEAVKCNGAPSIAKLWENASPSSSFPAQFLAMDLSGYDAVLILSSTGGKGHDTQLVPVGGSFELTRHSYTWAYVYGSRTGSVSPTGVTFNSGYYCYYANSADAVVSDTECVPSLIYGLKGVQ